MSGTPIDAITFYWRPGCGFCTVLDKRLAELGIPVDKRNIWEEPDHASTVRGIAGGNETVPTVVVGEVAMVNPRVGEVLEAVRSEAPHLEPADPPPERSVLDRVLGR